MIFVVINYELFSTFLSYGSGIKVLSPKVVVEHLKGQATQMKRLYKDS